MGALGALLGRSWALLGCSWDALVALFGARTGSSSDLADRSGSKSASKSDFGRSWVDFGTPGGTIFTIFRRSFAPAGRFVRRCAYLRKTQKNVGFYMFFARSLLRARFDNGQKNLPNRLLQRVAQRLTLGTRFFPACKRQNGPRGLPGAPWRGVLGLSWALLARSWDALESS